MARFTLILVRRVAASRLAWLLFVVHLCLVVAEVAHKETVSVWCSDEWDVAGASLIAGRSFHLYYESTLFKFLLLVDTPGLLLSMLLGLAIAPLGYLLPQPCLNTSSWVAAILMLVGTSVQWLVIGYGLERLMRLKKYSELPCRRAT